MDDTTTGTSDETPRNRRVSADIAIGLGLLGVATLGKLLWTVSDGGILAAFGAR